MICPFYLKKSLLLSNFLLLRRDSDHLGFSENSEKKGYEMKLLIIDNDKDWVEMLTAWLKTLGFEVLQLL